MTILNSLYVGVFGIGVVFIVLIGLSLLLMCQSALIARFSKTKPAKALVQDALTADAATCANILESSAAAGLSAAGNEVVVSPGPGKVLDVKVAVGAVVKRGNPVLLLDAMDMEFEIDATKDGTITQVLTAIGASVGIGTPLIEIQ